MKYIKQFAIIMIVSFLGECIKELLPFKIPASVYGLMIMLFVLMTGIIKLEAVKDTAEFFVENLPVMFIPPTVSLMASWPLFKTIFVPFLVITSASTIVVMVVTGHVSQLIIRLGKHKHTKNEKTKEEA